MGDATTLNLDPEREKAMSDMLAERALSDKKSDEDMLAKMGGIAEKIILGVGETVGKVYQGVVDVKDELQDVGVTLEEKLDDVVGFIVDPIRKALKGLAEELLGPLDAVTAAGIIVGAVYAFRDDVSKGLDILWNETELALELLGDELGALLSEGWEYLKVLWPHIEEGLVKLGDVVMKGLSAGWDLLENTVVPGIVDGVVSLGQTIWDYVPDWLQTGLGYVHDMATGFLKLPADIGGYISDGLSWLFEQMGLETLADTMDYLGTVLHGLAGWLGIKSDSEANAAGLTAKEVSAGEAKFVGKVTAVGGPAADAFVEAKGLGVSNAHAMHLSTLADVNLAASKVAMTALESAISGGMDPAGAYKVAFAAFNDARSGRAAIVPKGSASVGGGGSVAAERAAEIAVAKDTNAAINRSVALQERALDEQKRSADRGAHEVIDTVSSSDELSVHVTGARSGGLS